ncbi:MAG: fumarylacetoacetate hydrolase family protein [Xanthobacteraceae bacterium]
MRISCRSRLPITARSIRTSIPTTWRTRFRAAEWVTAIHTLHPGDILATGTNHRGLNPFMDGDEIELSCEGCGTLHITVRDPLKRTWARITRLQHKESGGQGVHTPQTGGKYAPTS